jgi:hypothetical protein
MTGKLMVVALLVALMLPAEKIPLANFAGKVHGSPTSKQITIENAEGNLLDFEVNRKTVITRAKKTIAVSDIQNGDTVTIEAKQEMVRFLVAVTITVQPKE